MKATIIIEKWQKSNKRIEKTFSTMEIENIKHKKVIKAIKNYIIHNYSNNRLVYVIFTIINHSEKKIEWITKEFKTKKGKTRYEYELKKIKEQKENEQKTIQEKKEKRLK